jgi:hypothetical protein
MMRAGKDYGVRIMTAYEVKRAGRVILNRSRLARVHPSDESQKLEKSQIKQVGRVRD